MNLPKMILFDYGQTLVAENSFNGESGTKAVLEHARSNPHKVSPEQIQELANNLNKDIGRFSMNAKEDNIVEVHNHAFQKYLYEYFDIEFGLTPYEMETIFWDHAAPGVLTEHILDFLTCIKDLGIRAGVISNISYSGRALENRINSLLPDHNFEFMLATSEYVFRKPHGRIFELALRKAKLNPSEVWYCGDNAYFDVEGAYQSGIFPVWYRGAIAEYNKFPPTMECLTIHDWRELIDYINGIRSASL